MNVLLSRGDEDFEATVEPEGSGYRITLAGRSYHVEGSVEGRAHVRVDARPIEAWIGRRGESIVVELRGRSFPFRVRDPRAPRLARRGSPEDVSRGELHAPMPGLVIEVLTREGDEVEAGHPVVVVEAMKMQNALVAPLKGRVRSIPVGPGTAVESGQLLLAITPEEG